MLNPTVYTYVFSYCFRNILTQRSRFILLDFTSYKHALFALSCSQSIVISVDSQSIIEAQG